MKGSANILARVFSTLLNASSVSFISSGVSAFDKSSSSSEVLQSPNIPFVAPFADSPIFSSAPRTSPVASQGSLKTVNSELFVTEVEGSFLVIGNYDV